MATAEQRYLVDREMLDHLVAIIRDGIAGGSSDRQIREQTMEILDKEFRSRTDRSLREMREGKLKRHKNAEAMIRDLSR